MINQLSYLALGDSYTIGEGVPVYHSFPYQLVQMLRSKELRVSAAEIVAKTGWTTGELIYGLNQTRLNAPYDFVTLLIGANNQYRGMSVYAYKSDLKRLLKTAVGLAADLSKRVVVMSIPDWGQTPFANNLDRRSISEQIGIFNSTNRSLVNDYGCSYLDITTNAPESAGNPEYLSADGLHPSEKAYQRWARLLTDLLISAI